MKCSDNIIVRKTELNDIEHLKDIFARARSFMEMTGNPDQWGDGYPSEELILDDISSGDSYVCVSEGRVVATFVLRGGDDPTYAQIYEGQWLDSAPYATIHRIASSGEIKRIFHIALQFALTLYDSIRIDTHSDNKVMQAAILKEGFRYCGVIRCWNGTERLAYQYIK